MIDLCVSKIGPCNRWTRAIDRCLARVLYMDSILCGATTHTHTRSLRVLSHCSRSFRILCLFVSLLFCSWFFNLCKIRMLLLLCIYFLFGGIFVALSWHSEARKWHSNKTLYADNRFQYDTSLFESRESGGGRKMMSCACNVCECMWLLLLVYILSLSLILFLSSSTCRSLLFES